MYQQYISKFFKCSIYLLCALMQMQLKQILNVHAKHNNTIYGINKSTEKIAQKQVITGLNNNCWGYSFF